MTDRTLPMTRARFAALAAAWGADPDRWPESEREPSRAFLREHPEAEAILAPERALDGLLSAWVVSPPPPFLDAAIASRVLAGRSALHRFRVWLAGGTAVAAVAGGLTAGIVLATLAAGPAQDPSQGSMSPLYGISVLDAPLPADGEDDGGSAQGGS